jgi:hypothetical protein
MKRQWPKCPKCDRLVRRPGAVHCFMHRPSTEGPPSKRCAEKNGHPITDAMDPARRGRVAFYAALAKRGFPLFRR